MEQRDRVSAASRIGRMAAAMSGVAIVRSTYKVDKSILTLNLLILIKPNNRFFFQYALFEEHGQLYSMAS